jgi:hypothetical protein
LSKSCQKIVKKLSKSCQKVVKKLSKVVKKLVKILKRVGEEEEEEGGGEEGDLYLLDLDLVAPGKNPTFQGSN